MTHSQDNDTERDNASGAGKEEPFDLKEYAFFVPLQMWGHTFYKILGIREPEELKNDEEECAAETKPSDEAQAQKLDNDGEKGTSETKKGSQTLLRKFVDTVCESLGSRKHEESGSHNEEGTAEKKKGNRPAKRVTTLNDFPLGPNRPEGDLRSDEEIARDVISRAIRAYHRPKHRRIPVMVFPMTLAQRFANTDTEGENTLKVLAPALKTRDDIFLFLYDGRTIDQNVAKLGYYGSKLTTTVLGEIYNSLVIKGGADPLFGKPLLQAKRGREVMQGGNAGLAWGYSLQFSPVGRPRKQAVKNNADYHGLIAAGPELKDFWHEPEWEAAVNLNAWIARRLKARYFVRAVFCTPFEVYHEKDEVKRKENRKQIHRFWREYCNRGIAWVLSTHKKCRDAHPVCINARTPSPVQAPIMMKDDEKEKLNDYAEAIHCTGKFLRLANLHYASIGEYCHPLEIGDFALFNNDAMAWTVFSKYFRDLLKESLLTLLQTRLKDEDTSAIDGLETELSKVVDRFVEGSDKVTALTMEPDVITAELKKVFVESVYSVPKVKEEFPNLLKDSEVIVVDCMKGAREYVRRSNNW